MVRAPIALSLWRCPVATFIRLLALFIAAVSFLVVPPADSSGAVGILAVDDPIDPQRWQDQQDMTWADYRAVPGATWADPARVPSQRRLKIALVAVDFSDQPFVITQPRLGDPFGNPQIDPIARQAHPSL
jgi:hypothetical protein